MNTTVATQSPMSRAVVEQHAMRLRERVLNEGCPYPDATMDANDFFLGHLRDAEGKDAHEIVAAHHKKMRHAEAKELWGVVGVGVGSVALASFCFMCAPVAASGVVATSAAIALRSLIHLVRDTDDRRRAEWRFVEQLRAWSEYDSDDVPTSVTSRYEDVRVQDLEMVTRSFAEDIKSFPYAAELTKEHARLMATLPRLATTLAKDGNQDLTDTATELAMASHHPTRALASVASRAAGLVRDAAWIGAAASLALGALPVTLACLGTVAGMYGVRHLASRLRDNAPDDMRTACSLAYWQQVIEHSQVLPKSLEEHVFGGDSDSPPQPDATIERTDDMVRIGGVAIPVQPAQEEDPA